MEILPEALARVPMPTPPHASLQAYVDTVVAQVPRNPDHFTLWRALSGIFAHNAIGRVSCYIGSKVDPTTKVFAATEVSVLLRNPNIDETTRDLLAYYQRCIRRGETGINVGFLSA